MITLLLTILGMSFVVAAAFGFPPAIKSDDGDGESKFTIGEQAYRLAPWIVEKCLDGTHFKARDAWLEFPEFQEAYSSAKGLGDCLGHGHPTEEHPNGHPDGFQLHRGSGRKFRPVRENAGRAWDRCNDSQRQDIANRRGVSMADIEDQIRDLPSVNPAPSLTDENEDIDA